MLRVAAATDELDTGFHSMAVIGDLADFSAADPNDRSERDAGADASALDGWRRRIDARLEARVAAHDDACPQLLEAMRYSLLAPGKRVRPLLAVLAALDAGGDGDAVLDFGCALEMVHCASLMLDDLPCMDDAQTRRGRPAAHRRFGEATTTLAAIALLNHAYGVIARDQALAPALRNTLVAETSGAVGTAGLVSGQSRDLADRAGDLDRAAMDRINRQKTGVLFELAVTGAGRIAGLPAARLDRLNRYAHHVGLAFQAADDLLDAHRPGRESGKDCGADRGKNGSVYVIGVDALRGRLLEVLRAVDAELAAMPMPGGRLSRYVHTLFGPLL